MNLRHEMIEKEKLAKELFPLTKENRKTFHKLEDEVKSLDIRFRRKEKEEKRERNKLLMFN